MCVRTTGRVALSAGSCYLVAVFVDTPALTGAAMTLSGLKIPVFSTARYIRPYRQRESHKRDEYSNDKHNHMSDWSGGGANTSSSNPPTYQCLPSALRMNSVHLILTWHA